MAAITRYHKSGGLKRWKFILSQLWRCSPGGRLSEGSVGGLILLWSSRGERFLSAPGLRWPRASLGLFVTTSVSLPPPSSHGLLCVSVLLWVCLIRTLVIGFRAHLDNTG